MRPPCSGAVASTSAAAAASVPLPSLLHHRRRQTSATATMHHRRGSGSSAPSSPLSRSLHASAAAASGDRSPSLRDAARRSAPHRRTSDSRSTRQPSPSVSTSAAPSASAGGYTPPAPVNYFESDAFSASPPPPESLTRPAYNRYRATIDIERSTVAGWEEVVPSAADPDWQPPAVSFRTLAAYPLPWLRFKVLPAQLIFVVAELWSGVALPLYRFMRRSWVVFGAAAVDRRVFGKQRRRKGKAGEDASDNDGGSGDSAASASASSLSPLELALQRWHGKRSPLDDLQDWFLALRGK